MLSNQILTIIADLRLGRESAPLLLSEKHICEVWEYISWSELLSLDELVGRSITDLLFYDCSDKTAGNHKADNIRKQSEKLYEKPAGDLLVAIFRHINILTDTSANALLRVFEDVPSQVLILVTSTAPQKIISTLLSRMLVIDGSAHIRRDNPLQAQIDEFLRGKSESLFSLTLAPSRESGFDREDALWIVQGLQDAIECGKLSVRHAKKVGETRIFLETTNTIAKYLIDQLLISLSCE